MKVFSWNVNGIRSVFKTTFREWLAATDPDIVCLQEIKADEAVVVREYSEMDGYYAYFNCGGRKGHSGVAVYTKAKPLAIESRLGIERFDDEGRCLKLQFNDFVLFNFYIPNGARDKSNMGYKLEVYQKLFPVLQSISNELVILTGDFNVAHAETDLTYPKQNHDNTMFTPAEREQITTLLNLGYIDAFRDKYPNKKAYTWWSYAHEARKHDIGWRIDYFFTTKSLHPFVQDIVMQREVLGSDYGPLGITLNKELDITEPVVYERKQTQTSLF